MVWYPGIFEFLSHVIDFIGVLVIVGGVFGASILFLRDVFLNEIAHHHFRYFRQNIARVLLVGLEFLVAGDLIRLVSTPRDVETVVGIVLIILIRSFLSMELTMEVEGRWPWQKKV